MTRYTEPSLTIDEWDESPIEINTRRLVGVEFVGKYIDEYLPLYATEGSSGVDLKADIPEPLDVYPGEVYKFGTGIKFNLPKNMEAQIRSRSGLAAKYGAHVVHGVGTVDEDYTGEVMMLLATIKPFTINPGDRVCQAIFADVAKVNFEVEVVEDKETRGSNGFGSTGK